MSSGVKTCTFKISLVVVEPRILVCEEGGWQVGDVHEAVLEEGAWIEERAQVSESRHRLFYQLAQECAVSSATYVLQLQWIYIYGTRIYIDIMMLHRAKLRAPAWSELGFSKDSPGFSYYYAQYRKGGARIAHGQNMVAAIKQDALSARKPVAQAVRAHYFGHRWVVVRVVQCLVWALWWAK